jgi:hypothetical protein
MYTTEQMIKYVAIFIIVFVGIFLFLYFYDQITGSKIIGSIECGILYNVPFGALHTLLTDGCSAVP